MRLRATAALMTASSRAQDAEQGRAAERAYFAQRFDDRKRELEKLEKRIFPPAASPQRGATAALMTASSRAQDAKQGRAAERAYFAQRFDDRKRELEKLEKRIFPPAARAAVVRQDSSGSTEGAATEESSAALHMEDVFQKLMKLTGVTEAEEVFDRFRAQRETCSRLGYLQQTTEEEKLALEKTQQALLAELEAFKFASVKDKDEAQDQINDLKAEIAKEEENIVELEKKNSEVDTLLMEIKKLLYDLCKLLDIVPDPPVPEWTAEARDIQEVVSVLSSRYAAAAARAADVRARRGDVTPVMPSNPPSGAASAAGVSTHTTPREAEAPVPTYKELLQREPVRPPPSDEEEDIPSRSYLKRQAQLILDTKSRRKGFRPPYPRK
ncbi:hypothetical protein JYU34_010789 [Plutella xylostella]|uniref:Uncharacterized protein n=1 Tax=Plutella xylostella TaxID=51655 RepID=A0ABQ7QF93_PLUXY|nr:hypothetical protein JYU34_010789 [Plutella xylostella]